MDTENNSTFGERARRVLTERGTQVRQNEIRNIVRSPDFVSESQVVFTPGRNKNRALFYDCGISECITQILRGICLTEFDVFFKSYVYYFLSPEVYFYSILLVFIFSMWSTN